MKRITILLAILIGFSNPVLAQTSKSDLIGLGMAPELANEIVKGLLGTGDLANNVYLTSRNAANTADISMIKVDATDDVVINSDSGDGVKLANNGTAQLVFDGANNISPVVSNTFSLGITSLAFSTIYSNIVQGATSSNLDLKARNAHLDLYAITSDATPLKRWRVDGGTGGLLSDATNGGDLVFSGGGDTVAIQEATAGSACSGTLTATGATPVVVSTSCATTGSRIFLQRTSAETGTVNAWRSALSNGVSFSVTSEAADTGTYDWLIIHEAP